MSMLRMQAENRISMARMLPAVLALMTLLSCSRAPAPAGQLIGVWKTDDPKYADRFFEITRENIIFGTGGDSSSTHRIVDLEQEQEDGAVLYAIHYLNEDGQEYKLALRYIPSTGAVRFGNQRQFEWTRGSRGQREKLK
jgi:hypothetical protein